ncbi:MAG: hypothetical protein O4965_26440 [Trichodesmium sp. St19_bin1]|nr:hypothetical protein [Trichodesmium sp. St19_bin1]
MRNRVMTTTPNTEPTLTDVINKLDSLSTHVDTLSTRVDTLSTRVDTLTTCVDTLTTCVDKLTTRVDTFNDRFDNYQKATQWLVQLAFTLIASATITVIVTSVLK